MSKISVIIPVYNVEQYLRDCLDTIVNQTHRDLEIICVNDGSTDGSLAILEEYASKDTRFIVLTKENSGPSATRNMGLDHATGEYIAFCDSDDKLDLTTYEKALVRAQETDADMTQFSFKLIGFPNRNDVPLSSIDEATDILEKVKLVNNNMSISVCYLWKASFIQKNNFRFHDKLRTSEDMEFTTRAAIFANKISVIHERLYFYLFRATSITGNRKDKTLLHSPWAFTFLFNDINNCNVSEEVRNYLLLVKWRSVWGVYSTIHKSLRSALVQQIRENKLVGEFDVLKNHSESLDFRIKAFFIILYSQSCLERLKTRIGLVRGICFNWLAKRLIPYSPWLQMICQTIDSQREEIQRLTAEKEKNNG